MKPHRLKIWLGALLLIICLLLAACRLVGGATPPPATEAAGNPGRGTIAKTDPPPTLPSEPTEIPAGPVDPAADAALLLQAQQNLVESGLLDVLPRYALELTIDEHGGFDGRAEVTYTNAEQVPLDRLYFRLLPNGGDSYGDGFLHVTAIRLDGGAVEGSLSLEDSVLEIPLPQALSPGERVQLELEFDGQTTLDFGGEDSLAGYGIYNFAEGVLALASWYPILAVYDEAGWHLDPVSPIGDSVFSDMAIYDVSIRLPREMVLASTGVNLAQEKDGDRIHYQVGSGPARDFFLIAGSAYQVASKQVGGVQINAYYLPGYAEAAHTGLEIAGDSLEIFTRRFGDYPYTELDVVQAPLRYALGVEYPSVILIGSELYDEPQGDSFAVAIAHEVAHQWWYNVVGNDVFAEPWLDEALTTYSSSLYYEERHGAGYYRGLLGYWQGRYEEIQKLGLDDLVTESLSHFEQVPDLRSYSRVVYSKGALFFAALRDEIGDRAFFTALQNYYTGYSYRIARGEDLLAAFEAAAGRELDELYDKWLYSAE